jgi:hypothetical protein
VPGKLLLVLSAIGGLQGVLIFLIAVFMLIPGEEPEKTLERILEMIRRHSRK